MEEKKLKGISTSIFSFEDIVLSEALYVDKTKYFYNLISAKDNCFFCARPRRFGKSLAVSIFKSIFEGKKDLFKGLYIYNSDYDWQTFPIIHMDMGRTDCSTAETLSISLTEKIKNLAEEYDLDISIPTPAIGFDSLISKLNKKTGKKVVILIDEYDKPLTENIENLQELEKVRTVLDSFYQIIKGQNALERFVFMTGVTKFSKVSIFSKLNNLTDISMNRDYALMFGYTQEELETYFGDYINKYISDENDSGKTVDKSIFLSEIKRWYNGFKFHYDAATVYNPVSIGQFFLNHCEFNHYWFSTGTPKMLSSVEKKNGLSLQAIRDAVIGENNLNAFMVEDFAKENVSPEQVNLLLFQTGYLTLASRLVIGGANVYRLKYPNFEVQHSFEEILAKFYIRLEPSIILSCSYNVVKSVEEGNSQKIKELLSDMLSQIPYSIQMKSEKYYQSLFYLFFKMCGMDISVESETNTGRIDAVMNSPKHLYLFELKLNKNATKAIEQIENKKYFEPFIQKANQEQKTIHCIGINFNSDKDIRNIDDWVEVVM